MLDTVNANSTLTRGSVSSSPQTGLIAEQQAATGHRGGERPAPDALMLQGQLAPGKAVVRVKAAARIGAGSGPRLSASRH